MRSSFIITYVDDTDEYWRKEYNRYFNTIYKESIYFKQNNLINVVLKSVKKYLSWIDDIILIVSSKSQLKNIDNCNECIIIEHKDFIPEKFLPTFNSNTIESFFGNLNLNLENIVYSNDDILFLKKTDKDLFFNEKGQALIDFKKVNIHNKRLNNFLQICLNSYILGFSNRIDNNKILVQNHGAPVPLIFNEMKKIFQANKNIIYKTCTPLRNNININQYVYGLNLLKNNKALNSNVLPKAYINLSDNNMDDIINILINKSYNTICVNETQLGNLSANNRKKFAIIATKYL